nr:DEAD/DEAH box helicase [Treponema phagedenis]
MFFWKSQTVMPARSCCISFNIALSQISYFWYTPYLMELSFKDIGLEDIVLQAIEAKGFETPTPIQILAIPRLLSGETNIIAKARTGTGKTGAFGLPLIQELRADLGHPRALVLVPTRELAMQVAAEIESFRIETYPRIAVVYGGSSMSEQLRTLKKGAEIIVGTPGRIIDHIERGSLDLTQIEYFILDEADEMLNMGFISDIETIFSKANSNARILMFSATMPKPILSIASDFMGDYEIVAEELSEEPVSLTEQFYWFVREEDKIEALIRLIDITPDFYGLVFCQTKLDADSVAKELEERGYEAAALHGDIPQNQREKILSRFRSKKIRTLVATDVAARGIDIEGITHVVNYAIPYDGPTYTHRIGRTGRAGSTGTAVSFIRPNESRKIDYLARHARGEFKEGKIPSIEKVLAYKETRILSELGEKLAKLETDDFNESFIRFSEKLLAGTAEKSENDVSLADENISEEITDMQNSEHDFEKRYNDKTEKQIIQILAGLLQLQFGAQLSPSRYKNIKPVRFDGGKKQKDSDQCRLYLALGRKEGMTKRKISQLFSSLLSIPEHKVDRIEVMEKFSLVSLPRQAAATALSLAKKRKDLPLRLDKKESEERESFPARKKSGRKQREERRMETFVKEKTAKKKRSPSTAKASAYKKR